ncbi:MAG: LysM domain-containing protein [Desulfobacterales bacterium]|jgi:LysM repeat protein
MTKSRMILTGITLAGALLLLVNCSRNRVESRQTPTDQPSLVYAVQPAPEPQPPEPETAVEPAPYVHTVRRSGETLIAISRWYTGAADNWKRLVDVNNGLNPRRIRVGDEILIPEELMKTHQPMPADFMTSKAPKKSVPSRVEPAPYVHTVRRSGETLVAISRWYTGSADNWKRLVETNNGLNPRRVRVGDKILIPGELLKTQQSMPADFMALKTQEKRAPTTSSPNKPTETNRIELFGPIENNDTVENPDVVGLPLESIE